MEEKEKEALYESCGALVDNKINPETLYQQAALLSTRAIVNEVLKYLKAKEGTQVALDILGKSATKINAGKEKNAESILASGIVSAVDDKKLCLEVNNLVYDLAAKTLREDVEDLQKDEN